MRRASQLAVDQLQMWMVVQFLGTWGGVWSQQLTVFPWQRLFGLWGRGVDSIFLCLETSWRSRRLKVTLGVDFAVWLIPPRLFPGLCPFSKQNQSVGASWHSPGKSSLPGDVMTRFLSSKVLTWETQEVFLLDVQRTGERLSISCHGRWNTGQL